MSDYDTVVDRYLAVWNEPDETARRAALDELFADGIRYVDPLAAVEGRAGLDALIGAVRQQFPGHAFTPGGPVDGHHDQVRFTWNLTAKAANPANPANAANATNPANAANAANPASPANGANPANGVEPLVVGFDVAELDADGRINRVLGFIDKAPAA